MSIYTYKTANNRGSVVYQPNSYQATSGGSIPQPDYSGDNSKYLTRFTTYAGARSVLGSFNYGNIYDVSRGFTAVSGIEFSHTGTDHANFLCETPESYDGRTLDVSIRWQAPANSLSGVLWGVRAIPYSAAIPAVSATGVSAIDNYTTGLGTDTDSGIYSTTKIQIPSADLTGMGGEQNFVFSVARFSQNSLDQLDETVFVRDVNVYKAGHPTYG